LQPLSIAELDQLVRRYFTAELWLTEGSLPAYILQPSPNMKERFRGLYQALRPLGLAPLLRREEGRLVLRLIPLPKRRRGGRKLLALMLFLATLATILAAGYVITLDPLLTRLDEAVALNPLPHLVGYAVCMAGVVGVHELGHMAACRAHGIKSSPPYFIPFPPISAFPVGTLGAVIMQEDPPLSRDTLFDIGISGPLLGFAASLMASAVGLALSHPVSEGLLEEYLEGGGVLLPIPLIYRVLIPAFNPGLEEAAAICLHPIAWAGWVGLLITFLNAFPAAQLDGGHVLRALLSERLHVALSAVFVAVMFLTGFWAMALVAAALTLRRHPGALDDATPLSFKRRLGVLALIAMWLASLPFPPLLWP